jgi:hypothetical protein
MSILLTGGLGFNCEKIMKELEWKARYEIEDMCRDSYNYYRKNI